MATKTLPAHGTLHRRKTYKCACHDCRQADRNYTNTRTRLIAYGQWQPYINAEPVRAHVRMLMSHGIGWQRVARLAGVSNGGLSRILYGDYSRGTAHTKRVRTLTADKILAVRPDFTNLAPSARVDATGIRRRLQALIANGWPQLRLAQQLGIENSLLGLMLRRDEVEVATVLAVRDLYDRLWNVDPATSGARPRFIDAARTRAARNNWPVPAAWDDDYIDSPAGQPDTGEEAPSRYQVIAENSRWLINEHGYKPEQAAQRLGITSRHLYRAFAAVPLTEPDTETTAQPELADAAA